MIHLKNTNFRILEKQVNTDVDELQNLLAELTDIVANIKRLKTQKKYVRKEATTVKNLAQRAKDNGEMLIFHLTNKYSKAFLIIFYCRNS